MFRCGFYSFNSRVSEVGPGVQLKLASTLSWKFLVCLVRPRLRSKHKLLIELTSYQPEESRAVLSGPSSAQSLLSVQTTLVEPFQPILGAQYFVLGEIEKTDGLGGVLLRSRALTCVDGVDLALMQQAIVEQRRFFKERETEMNVQAPCSESPPVKNL